MKIDGVEVKYYTGKFSLFKNFKVKCERIHNVFHPENVCNYCIKYSSSECLFCKANTKNGRNRFIMDNNYKHIYFRFKRLIGK